MQGTLRISRSGLKLFLDCPRCFWLDKHHKIRRPFGYPYTLSAAVDYLAKQEFDKYRAKGTLPPIFKDEKLDAKLFSGPELPDWRNNFKGISYYDEDLDAVMFGAVDDVLEFSDGSLAVIDYKSSGSREVVIYDDYQKQMDVYTHILHKMGYSTQPNAYFVVYHCDKSGGGFKNVLPFNEILMKVDVKPDWIPAVFEEAVNVARQKEAPIVQKHCDHCHFVEMASQHKIIPDLNI